MAGSQIPFEDQPEAAVAEPAPETAPAVAQGLSAAEELTLADLVARKAATDTTGTPPVRMKVGPPHSSMTFGGTTVGNEFTDVPAHLVPAFTQAAIDAGVTLIPEG